MMPGYLLAILLGLILALVGFGMAFRQVGVRRWLGRPAPPRSRGEDEDPLAYALRIAGVMVMAFGIVIATMVAIVHFAT